jgi:hypothetical protein
VNAVTRGEHHQPSVAMDPSGGFVVAWADDSDNNGFYEIRAKGFTADGRERFGDITINASSAGQQVAPVVATDVTGNFVVAWQDDKDRNNVYEILARGFRADGTLRFGTITVNQVSTGQQRQPAIAMEADGSFVIAWEDDSKPPRSVYNIFARRFSSAGVGSAQFQVNSNSDGQQLSPRVAVDPAGNACFVWEDDSEPPVGLYNIYARAFKRAGTPLFSKRVNVDASGQQGRPDIATLADGRFAVSWEDDRDENGAYQVRARLVDAVGQFNTDVIINSNPRGQQRRPHIAARNAGLVIVWEDDIDANNRLQILGRGVAPW